MAAGMTEAATLESSTTWASEFFTGAWLDIQQAMGSRDEQADAEVQLLMRVGGIDPGSRVLDVPCGEGRVSRAFARRGCSVVGVDITPALLDTARQRAADERVDVEMHHGDMRELSFDANFDLAVSMWSSIGYGTEHDDLSYFRGVHSALRPGGRFAVDTQVVESILPRLHQRFWDIDEGLYTLTRVEYDWQAGRVNGEWIFAREGQPFERKTSSIRLYTVRELTESLRSVGFQHVDTLLTRSGEPFQLGSGRALIVVEKPR